MILKKEKKNGKIITLEKVDKKYYVIYRRQVEKYNILLYKVGRKKLKDAYKLFKVIKKEIS